MSLTMENLEVGSWYRAKKIRKDFWGQPNDRQVLWLGKQMYQGKYTDCVQYDSNTVKDGRRYPIVSVEAFLKWAKEKIVREEAEK